MKTIIFLLCPFFLFAQQTKEIKNDEITGFYLSLSDFKTSNIHFPTDMKHKGDKIKLNKFYNSSSITVIEKGEKVKYPKDSIFAIKDNSNNVYRFINQNPAKIIDTSFLYIYEYLTTKTVSDGQNSKRSITKQVPVTIYYFSYKFHKQIYLLTMENIRDFVLKDIPQVHTQICSKFTNDNLLKEFSQKTGIFTINDAFKEVLKK